VRMSGLIELNRIGPCKASAESRVKQCDAASPVGVGCGRGGSAPMARSIFSIYRCQLAIAAALFRSRWWTVQAARAHAMDRATFGLAGEYQRRHEYETRLNLARCGVYLTAAEICQMIYG
jgi:hypothetical protein